MANQEKESPEMSVREAIDAFPNEWILMDLTERQDDILTSIGRVVTHKLTLRRMSNAATRWERQTPAEQRHFAFFFQGVPLPTAGDHVRNAFRAAIEEGLELGRRT